MDYSFTITGAKALDQVIMHVAVFREQKEFPYQVRVWQKTELFDEEAHPEPWKWAMQHTMQFFETF